MSGLRSFLAGLASIWAFLVGFLASLAWFIWTETQQTSSSCGNGPDYLQSAAITFLVIIAVIAVRRRARHGQTVGSFLGEVLATAAWTALDLSVAIFFAAATGCSA
jgi:riboflavin transporter FmnP